MQVNEAESLLRYYTSELNYLRQLGAAFARRYPRVASQLELSTNESADPHVERLIESVALLTARLQRRLDGEFPEITAALLGVLYPHLVNPVPPIAIARIDVDPDKGKITTGYEIAAGTPLFSQTDTGLTCRFRTCYPVTLWPLEILSAGFESPAQFSFLDNEPDVAGVLRVRLGAHGVTLEELSLDRLRFHITGSASLVHTLYELLFCHTLGVAVLSGNGKHPVRIPREAILAVGLEPADEVIPYPSHALPAYRLLQEYFVFPEKYHFFDLTRLSGAASGQTMDLLILLDRLPQNRLPLDRRHLQLGCTPIINLFRKTSEPIRVDQRSHEYRLDPDMRRERTTEVHSVLSVSASSNPAEETEHLDPFYSMRHRLDGRTQRAYWYARRVPTGREDLPGTDILLSFVDLDFNPKLPPGQVVYAHTLCTNREFATQLPAGARLQIEETGPIADITCLDKPTFPVYPPLGGKTLWYLISNLSLNYLSLSGGGGSLEALREILRLYSFSDQPSTYQQVQGIREMTCRRVTRRIGKEPWRGFCQGTEVTLTFDESLYVGSGAFLLGSVLDRFLPLYASINSFTQVVIRSLQREGDWRRWPPRAGLQELL
jgi:type VI secretion system protein ImpG